MTTVHPTTLPELLDGAAQIGGHIAWQGGRVPYSDLRLRSIAAAAGLASLGVRRGDVVGLSMPNSPDWLAIFFACTRLGAAVLVLNTRLAVSEMCDLVDRAAARALIHVRPDDAVPAAVPSPTDAARLDRLHIIVGDGFDAAWQGAAARSSLEELLHATGRAPAQATAQDVAFIFSTSGSTGASKLVLHSHGGAVSHSLDVVRSLQLDEPDTVHFMPLPLAGAYGLTISLVAIASGETLVMQEKFDPAAAVQLVQDLRVTNMYLFDDAIQQLLDAAGDDPRPFPHVRWCGFGIFNPALKDFIARTEARGIRLLGMYGSSETGALFAVQRPGDPMELRTRPGGFCVSRTGQFRIRDLETGELLPPGRQGEIEVRDPGLMKRYLGEIPAMAQMLPDGFFRTGDTGSIAEDGSLLFKSRIADVLRLSGFLVLTAEIEAVVAQAEGVAACVVVGVQLPQGSRPVAFVKLTPGGSIEHEAMLRHCNERLARYKVPIGFHVVDEFPIGGSLNAPKIDKNVLRENAARLHGATRAD